MSDGRKFSEAEAIIAGANPKILELFSMIATDLIESTSLMFEDANDQNREWFKATVIKFTKTFLELTDEERMQLQQRIDCYINTQPDANEFKVTLQMIQELSETLTKLS